MKYPVNILFSVLAIMLTLAAAQDCITASQLAEFTVIGDQVFHINDPVLLTNPPGLDSNLTYFREILRFTDEEIDMAERNAMELYNTRFGLDFAANERDGLRRRFFQNATFFPINVPVPLAVTSNRWITSGNTKSRCFPTAEGGFEVAFTGEQMLHGTYGGERGIGVSPSDILVYNWYNIEVCPQQPIIIQYQSVTPTRASPIDGFVAVHSELFHRTLGRGLGRATSRSRFFNNNTMFRSDFWGIMLFPALAEWEV